VSIGDTFNIIDGKTFGVFDSNNGEHLQKLLNFKELFVLEHWNLKYPGSIFSNHDDLLLFIQRSKELQEWYRVITARFAYLKELPDWVLLSDDLREYWITDSSTIFKIHKDARKKIVKEKEDIWKGIEAKLAEVDAREASLLDSFYRKHPIVAINKIPIQGLPSDRLLKHCNKSGSILDSALNFELNSYKHELALKYVAGDGSLDELVALLSVIL